MTPAPAYKLYSVPAEGEAAGLTEEDIEEMAEFAIGVALGSPPPIGLAGKIIRELNDHGLKVVAA